MKKKLFFLLGLVGLSSMIIQISLLTIFLSFFYQSSIVTGVIIGGWIFGLGLGGLIVSKKVKINKPERYIVFFQYFLGISVLLFAIFSSKVFNFLDSLNWFAFPLTFLYVTKIGMLSGTTFLLINTFYKENKDEMTAKLYSSENFGAGFSSIIAGVLLLPFLGVQISLIFSSILCFGVGFVFAPRKKVITYLPLVFIVLLIIPFGGGQEGVLFKQNSPYGEVKVLENGFLQINSRTQCSFKYLPNETTERTIVNYSLEPLSREIDVLNIGLGCGGTLSEILKHTDNQVDIVEINKVVVKANKKACDLLKNKQINLIVDEGLNYLRNSNKKYDSIIIDIENPGVVHSSNIYTNEAFQVIKKSLNEKGVFGLWIYPCNKGEYYDVIYNTLKENFDYVYHLEDTIFIASDKELDYEIYVPYTEDKRINTINKNTISTLFLKNCWSWNNG